MSVRHNDPESPTRWWLRGGMSGEIVRCLALGMLLSLWIAAPGRAQAQPTYRLTILGTLGGSWSEALSISDNGRVAGLAYTSGNSSYRAVLYASGAIVDLGTLGGNTSVAFGVNNAGQVVGYGPTGLGLNRAFLWSGGVMTDLGTLGGTQSSAFGINTAGQVVGNSLTSDAMQHACLWSGGAKTDLGTLGGTFSSASAINESGQVVGYSATSGNGATHAFLFSGGGMTDLGTLGGMNSYAQSINASSQIVGRANDASGATRPFLYANGVMSDLGTLGGSGGIAFDINDSGQVVGFAHTVGNADRGFLYTGGVMYNLNDLLDTPNADWTIREARSINNDGVIAGRAVHNVSGQSRAVVLTPVQANSAPEAGDDSATTDEDGAATIDVLANDTDPDKDALTIQSVSGPVHGSAEIVGARILYTPSTNYNGTDSFTYTIDDGNGATATATVNVTILPINDSPVAQDDPASLDEDSQLDIDVLNNDNDPDGDTLAITQVSSPTHGTATILNGLIRYTPAPNYNGNDSFTYTTDDGNGATATATVNLTVRPVNDAPTATLNGPEPGLVLPLTSPIALRGAFSDIDDADTHSATWTLDSGQNRLNPSATLTGATIADDVAVPAPGVYNLRLTVTDSGGLSASADTVGGLPAYVVVYDPNGGSVSGGGVIDSPAGAYAPDPSLVGPASFGFTCRYHNGAQTPDGQAQFRFNVAQLRFQSSSLEWLVVSGARAQFRGTGTINGSGDYAFTITAVDGAVAGGGGVDRFRIRIWDRVGGGLVYDNMPGSGGNDPLGDATILKGGNIVING